MPDAPWGGPHAWPQILAFVSRVRNIGSNVDLSTFTLEEVEANIVRCPDAEAAGQMIDGGFVTWKLVRAALLCTWAEWFVGTSILACICLESMQGVSVQACLLPAMWLQSSHSM